MRETYLIGINHKYQLPDVYLPDLNRECQLPDDIPFYRFASEDEQREFRDFISHAIARYGIRGIAEEMSLEALSCRSISGGSILRGFANEANLLYRACDLEPRASTSQREHIWIRELLNFNTFPVLFVLGADHTDSFERLLRKSGFSAVCDRRALGGMFRYRSRFVTGTLFPPRLFGYTFLGNAKGVISARHNP